MAQASIDTILRSSLAQIGKPHRPDPARVQVRDLAVLAYTQGITWWSYKGLMNGARPAVQALQPGYFDDAA